MRQRVPSTWRRPEREGHAPRLLVESDDPVLAVSDFSMFAEAGFVVAHCAGPAGRPEDCPLLRGEDCGLVEDADVVLHRLEPASGVLEAILERHPEVPVVTVGDVAGAERGPRPVTVIAARDPVDTQIRALYRALRTGAAAADGG
jgi:hypothetical protein